MKELLLPIGLVLVLASLQVTTTHLQVPTNQQLQDTQPLQSTISTRQLQPSGGTNSLQNAE